MQPGDTVYFTIYRQTAAGAASTGKVLADFTIQGYKDGATASVSPSIVSIGTTGNWCAYKLVISLPTGGPYQFSISIQAASGTDIVTPHTFSGEIEQQDTDSIFASVIKPVASLSSTSVLASQVDLNLIAYRQNPIAVSVVNQSGTPVDLSGYNNWRFSVWDKTHSGTILFSDALDIAGSAGGAVTFNIPEDAAFYSQIAAAFAAGTDNTTLYYDVIADFASDPTKTRTILRGRIILWRYEGAA